MVKRRKVLKIFLFYRREGGGKKRGDSGWTWGKWLKSRSTHKWTDCSNWGQNVVVKKPRSDLKALTLSRKVPSGRPRRSALPAGERIERTKI